MDLTNPQSVIERLKKAGVWSKKRLGQHFLIDKEVLENIVENSTIQLTDTVIEIGPGMGVLSRLLLEKTSHVVAFEYDYDMVHILQEDIPSLQIISGDALKTVPPVVSQLMDYKVVANIPYQITTPLLRLFLEHDNPPQSLTLLVQKEVGQRLTAAPKTSGRGYLSVMCEYFGIMQYSKTVPAASFWPAPQVDSAVIHMEVKPVRFFSDNQEKEFLKFVRTLFINPRKQLKNVLAGMRGVSPTTVTEYFAKLGLPDSVRAQELSLEEWKQLYTNPFTT